MEIPIMVLCLWIIPVLFLTLATLVGINLGIESAAVATFLDAYLAIVGVFTVVLVAIVTWIHSQGVSSRQVGFGQLRSATRKLSTLSNSMYENLGRASPQHQQLLANWADATDRTIEHLNEIKPAWAGWERDKDLEPILREYTDTGATVLQRTGAFLPRDLVWSRIWIDIDSSTRDVDIGLYWMSEGARAGRLFRKLMPFLISTFALLISTLVGRVVLLTHNVCDKTNSVLVIFFTLSLVLHLFWLGYLFLEWWNEQRRQEEAWQMSDLSQHNT